MKLGKQSADLRRRARAVLPGGTSHNLRAFAPEFLVGSRGKGAYIWDADGRKYIDFWQSHNSALLGHAHPVVLEALTQALEHGVHLGTVHEGEIELAEKLRRHVPALEKLRFTTGGSEATMYATRLARAFTGRTMIAKAKGGWHGGNEALLHAVSGVESESAGLLPAASSNLVAFSYNDIEGTKAMLRSRRAELAAVIVEPVLGDGGAISATREFLKTLRDEADDGGFLLAFDEVLTGFRLRLGGWHDAMGVQPDLTTFGKVIGGELPIGVYGGRDDILALAEPLVDRPACWTGGGTFSAHPLAMAAGLAVLSHLEHHPAIYDRLAALAERAAKKVDASLEAAGIHGVTMHEGSLVNTLFPAEQGWVRPRSAEDIRTGTDLETQHAYRTLLLEEGVFILPGHGCAALSTAHAEEDVEQLAAASARVAARLDAGSHRSNLERTPRGSS